MRLIRMFSLAALAAVATTAFTGTTSASADKPSTLCLVHKSLICPIGQLASIAHLILKEGTIGKLLSPISVLCLGVLIEASPLGLANPLPVHALKISLTGCGTGSAHNNCTMTVEELPLYHLLKTGLDQGVLTALSGRKRLQCPNIGINCEYDLEGSEFSVGGGHVIANETPTIELGGKFFCPDEGFLDFDVEPLPGEPRYLLE